MSLTITTDVFCDECGAWNSQTGGATGMVIMGHEARRKAKSAGYVCLRENGKLLDLCPDCFAARQPLADDGRKGDGK